jgi:ABC-2 type transport system ATP-binding protein
MLGLTDPDAGTISVLGFRSNVRGFQIRGQVGYVPEQPTLYDWMTVNEAGWFASGFYAEGYLAEYQRITDQFCLPANKQIKKLSKGMRAKVVLSLAMAHRPPLLVLDEPTSGLDTLVRREFLESMVDLTAAGQTVFLSSHQIAEVERVADIVAILREGRVLLVEPLDELKETAWEVIITFNDVVNRSVIPSRCIHEQTHGRQSACLVRGRHEEELYRLQSLPDVRTVDIKRPSLEDIFVAYMRSDLKYLECPDARSAEPIASTGPPASVER